MTIIILADPPDAPTVRDIFLPAIFAGTPNPVADFLRLLTGDARQERPTLERCPALESAAEERAFGLAHGDPWAHVDRNGVTPNEYARNAGCRLPAHYAARGNNVESLGAGTADAAVMFAALTASQKHGDHLLGRTDFYRVQRHVGIALAEGGEYGWYWVIMLGTCEGVTSGE